MHRVGVVLILAVTGMVKGWECNAGCSTENGFCEKPGKCRCKPGWQGENCDQCVPFPGCLHGACEKAWQCICKEGWVGSLCDQDTRLCSSRLCASNATCIETGEGGYLCICPQGYAGENCNQRTGLCLTNGSMGSGAVPSTEADCILHHSLVKDVQHLGADIEGPKHPSVVQSVMSLCYISSLLCSLLFR